MAILGELHASMIRPSAKDDVLADSDLVVVGKVESIESYRRDFYITNVVDGRESLMEDYVLTDWKIEVLETLKGDCESSPMKLTWIGGTIDGKTSTSSMDFHLDIGDVALFFLSWNERNEKWIPRGASARVFLVEDYGGVEQLRTTNEMLVVGSPDELDAKRTGPLLGAETLEDFEDRKLGCVSQ